MAERCKAVGAKLLHYSTDYVFDGTATTPYPTDHPRNPVNAYGRSKALGEDLIERSGVEHLLVRSSWLYAPWGTELRPHDPRARQGSGKPSRRRRPAGTTDRQPKARGGEPGARRAGKPGSLARDRRGRVQLVRVGGADRRGGQPRLPRGAVHERRVSASCTSSRVQRAGRFGDRGRRRPLIPWEDRVRDVLARVASVGRVPRGGTSNDGRSTREKQGPRHQRSGDGPRKDLSWTASRASGPGGQNVNKVATKVTLRFDLRGTEALTRTQKARLRKLAGKRIDAQGTLRISAQAERSQRQNLERARDGCAN